MSPIAKFDPDEQTRWLLQAGRKSDVALDLDTMISLGRKGETVIAAAVRGLNRIDPADYARGVDAAYAYINMPNQPESMPPGFYTIRAVNTGFDGPGRSEGIVQFIDGRGYVAAELPAQFNTLAPRDPDAGHPAVELAGSLGSLGIDIPDPDAEGPPDDGGLYIKCHENGEWFCYRWWEDTP